MFGSKKPTSRNWRNDLAASQRILTAFMKAEAAGVLLVGDNARIVDGVLHISFVADDEKISEAIELSYENVVEVEKQLRELCKKEDDEKREDKEVA